MKESRTGTRRKAARVAEVAFDELGAVRIDMVVLLRLSALGWQAHRPPDMPRSQALNCMLTTCASRHFTGSDD
ncbi:MAG TPA: hypothetical protein VEX18_03640 [Polyangiaceae bacterium]|nr:hypothetical protein [Polyangiaceae bacterium]